MSVLSDVWERDRAAMVPPPLPMRMSKGSEVERRVWVLDWRRDWRGPDLAAVAARASGDVTIMVSKGEDCGDEVES